MGPENKRYKGLATVLHSYRDQFEVECPKCGRHAIIHLDNPFSPRSATITCSSCNFNSDANKQVRYNIIIKRNCDNCGKKIEKVIPEAKNKVKEITLSCPHCQVTRTFEPRNEETVKKFNSNGKAADPFFNLPLWLQTDIKGNLFWAFNRRHLADLRHYVDSKLRERQTQEYTTMVERLPTFITSAKNREAVLKAIDRLLRKENGV